jgi:hypothetical protein
MACKSCSSVEEMQEIRLARQDQIRAAMAAAGPGGLNVHLTEEQNSAFVPQEIVQPSFVLPETKDTPTASGTIVEAAATGIAEVAPTETPNDDQNNEPTTEPTEQPGATATIPSEEETSDNTDEDGKSEGGVDSSESDTSPVKKVAAKKVPAKKKAAAKKAAAKTQAEASTV